jgi:hypothetical protein
VAAPVDPSGAYLIRLPAGSWRVQAAVDDQGGLPQSGGELLAIEEGSSLVRDLPLPDEPLDPLALTVLVQEAGGAPAAGALVRLVSAEQGVRFFAALLADEQGRVQLVRPRGDLPALLEAQASNDGRTGTTRFARDQDQVPVLVQLQAAGRIAGHLAGATAELVSVATAASPRRTDGSLAECEFAGDRFLLDGVEPGPVQVSVRSRDGRFATASAEVQAGATAPVELSLERAPAVTGRVVDESGAPLPAAVVLVDYQPRPEAPRPDGRFLLTDLSPGEHVFLAGTAPGLTSSPHRVTLAAGQQLELGDLAVLAPRAQPGTIGAQLRGDSGQVVVQGLIAGGPAEAAGLMVGDQIRAVDGAPVSGVSDARGRLIGQPRTPVRLTIVRNGGLQDLSIQRAG